MCGRFIRTSPLEAIRATFEASAGAAPALTPRFNICPGEDVVAIVQAEGERRVGWLRWGLVPSFATDARSGPRAINARAETVAERPAFRTAVRRRRCLVIADGFYEWRREGRARLPYLFQLALPEPFAFAGLWDRWTPPEGPPLVSCAILTTTPNDLVAPIHDRMPVVLTRDTCAPWLDPTITDPAALQALLVPYPAAAMRSHAVRPLVNSPSNDSPECVVGATKTDI